MPEYFKILYVNTRLPTGGGTRLAASAGEVWPQAVQSLRDWTWQQSAVVRWEGVRHNSQDERRLDGVLTKLANASLLVLDWSSANAGLAIQLYERLRNNECNAGLPILAVDWSRGREPVRGEFTQSDPRLTVVSEEDLGDSSAVAAALERIGVALPAPRLKIAWAEGEVVVEGFLRWLGQENLELTVQKFFPDGTYAKVEPVGGGWSDAKLVRVLVRGERSPYFIKFFTDGVAYRKELKQNEDARAWLAEAGVPLRRVPDLDGDILTQTEAFPPMEPCTFPVCYGSASTTGRPRETLKDFYRTARNKELERVMRRLLDILSKDQKAQAVSPEETEPPWDASIEDSFWLTPAMKESLLSSLDDLSLYGTSIFAGERDLRWQLLEGFSYMPLPGWLVDWRPVLRGHVHGDPNPRNCLVSKNDPQDLVLIDCGEYRANGRLVSDLAIIERDIKLVMMGSEQDAGGFFDLDVGQLRDWCAAERIAAGAGLGYAPPQEATVPDRYSSAPRAYRLVGMVREQAKRVCGDWDPSGNHYFAALLFRTLEILMYPAVRCTKKLLALYSASEILCRQPRPEAGHTGRSLGTSGPESGRAEPTTRGEASP